MATNWYDLNKDGKRLDFIIRTMIGRAKNLDLDDPDDITLYFAYIDRVIKATHTKVGIAETVLQINQILQEAKKSLPTPAVEVAQTAQ